MEAAVPFALLAGVQVVAFAAALGLAATGATAAYRRSSRGLLLAGGLLLAASHALSGAELGSGASDTLALLRAGGYASVALGVSGLHVVGPTVVVPLGTTAPPAVAASLAAAVAAVATLRARRRGSMLLVAGFVLAAVAEALGPYASTRSSAAVLVLLLRGGWALLTAGFVARVAETRLLSKVVAAILAGVLALAAGIALVVGSVTTRALSRDTAAAISRVAEGQVESFRDSADTAQSLALVVAACPPPGCARVFALLSADPDPVIARIGPGNRVPEPRTGLTDLEAHHLAQSGIVAEARRTGAPAATLEVLLGARPRLVALGVAPPSTARPGRPVDVVYVFGSVVGQERVERIEAETDYAATVFVGDAVVVSSLPPGPARATVEREYRRRGIATTLAGEPEGVTVQSEGGLPAVRFQALRNARGDTVAVLAMSASSDVVLATQRSVLRALFVGTLVVAVLVGLLAFALGRRIVRPVQQLTMAAARVRRGELDVRTEVDSADELGVLSRTFDAMTASLSSSTRELRRAAEDEAELRGRLQGVFDSVADGLVTTDAAGRVTAVNRAGTRMLGAGEHDLVGRPVGEVLAGTDASGGPLVGELTGPAVRTGVLVAAGGRALPVSLALTPLRGEEGHVLVVRDTTREREVERMKTEFLANVSHELRTPLTPIRGYAEILTRHPDLPAERTAEYAGSILDSSLRMARVVDLLVDVAALEGGRVVPTPRAVAVTALVDDRLAVWRRRVPDREFRRRVERGLPRVFVDEAWVAKALDELLDNAVKYCEGPVTLTASAVDGGRRVRLTVRDTGPGIAEERRSALFQPFEQLDGSATRSVGGLGLGLSFVRRVADVFGIGVTVESTLGRGSAFSLDVPAVHAAAAPARRTRRAPR